MMYVIYNYDGSIKYKLLNEFVVQGNNNVNEIFVCIEGREPEEYSLYANFKLPNGSTTTVVSTTPTTEFIEGIGTFTGRKILLSNTETLVAGALQMNVVCLDENDAKLVAFNTYITVNETGIQLSDPILLTVQEYENLLVELKRKMEYPTKYVRVSELPENPDLETVYVLDVNETLTEVYMYNGKTNEWIPLGSNRIDLGNYYTKEESEQFEEDINDEIEDIRSEVESVASGSPKGVYSTLADLQSAYPTGTSGIYVVSADGHWYYWNGSAWTDGGIYLSSLPDNKMSKTSTNSLQNKVITENLTKLAPLMEQPFLQTLNLKEYEIRKEYVSGGPNNGYINLSGVATDTTYGVHTDLVCIDLFNTVTVKSNVNTSGCAVAFYDDLKNFMFSLTITPGWGNNMHEVDLTSAKENGAKYISVSGYEADAIIIVPARQLVGKKSLDNELKEIVNSSATVNEIFNKRMYFKDCTIEKSWVDGSDENNGYVLRSDGTVSDTSNGVNTGFIDITFVDLIAYETHISGAGKSIAFYDENKNYLSALGINEGQGSSNNLAYYSLENSKLAGAKYMILSSYKNNLKVVLKAQKIIAFNSFEEETIKTIFSNPYPKTKKVELVVPNKYIATNGTIGDGAEGGGISDYYSCETVYAINVKTNGNETVASVAFYDANYQFISSSAIIPATNPVRNGYSWVFINQVKPENAKYFRISAYSSVTTSNGGIYIIAKGQSPLNNKNILIFGDSISDSATITINDSTNTTSVYNLPINSTFWTRIMYDKVAPKELRCYAQSQAKYPFDDSLYATGKRKCATYQVQLAINDADNPNGIFPQDDFVPDVIIFALGTNGSLNDTYESALAKTVMQTGANSNLVDIDATMNNLDIYNYMEAMRWCYMAVKKKWSKAQLFQIIPPQKGTSNDFVGTTNTKYEEQVKMAKYYGATIVDIRGESGICRDFQADTLMDTLHPNATGHNLYARCMIKAVEKAYMDVDDMNI